ncbi:hypothetical protein TrLO_g3446 [Triparma laevis f. longispina]|uniref:Mitochondrial carrier n=1 Tax=Triparma laevis f. longispina TaxID=1714387 RepID=A0A9W6ZYS4_9STRA|nr:hypothetical protein TrLO_g3446 [Triparma laevis f. longispina]
MSSPFPPSSSLTPFYAGLLAGCTSTALLYPLELIKVRMQVNESYSARGLSSQFYTEFKTLLRIGGGRKAGIMRFRGLYNGLFPSLIGNGVSWGGYFYVYEKTKSFLLSTKPTDLPNHPPPNLTTPEYMAAAAASGAFMVMCTNPIWLIKTRIQLQIPSEGGKGGERNYTGVVDAGIQIIKNEGFLALYKGVVPALALVSHGVVQFSVYENLKKAFPSYASKKKSTDKNLPPTLRLIDSIGYLSFGACSKIIASTITYPVQVVKSRLQQRQDHAFEIVRTKEGIMEGGELKKVRRNYSSVLGTVKSIYRGEGVTGFFKGSIANGVRVAPNAAVTFLVYEGVCDFCR